METHHDMQRLTTLHAKYGGEMHFFTQKYTFSEYFELDLKLIHHWGMFGVFGYARYQENIDFAYFHAFLGFR